MGGPYKHKHSRRSKGRFIKLDEWLLKAPAWAVLSCPARCLYLEVKRRYNGNNNGSIRLSHREAAALLGMHRNSIGKLFQELESLGFLTKTSGHYLGPSGIGLTSNWLLEECLDDRTGHPAGKRFMRWKPESPHKQCATTSQQY